jgi:hypothetical protein
MSTFRLSAQASRCVEKSQAEELKGAGRHSGSWVRVSARASKFHVNNDDEGKGSCFPGMHSLKFIGADIISHWYDIRMR